MNILFLCVANSARSQLAEGLGHHLFPPGWTSQSAGSIPTKVRPQAIAVMSEIGIDIRKQWSKGMDDIEALSIDCVITLCAEESCPSFLQHAERIHWPIPDPAGYESEDCESQQHRFREARETIRIKLEGFIKERAG